MFTIILVHSKCTDLNFRLDSCKQAKYTATQLHEILVGGHKSGPVNSDVSRVNIVAILHAQSRGALLRQCVICYHSISMSAETKLVSNHRRV